MKLYLANKMRGMALYNFPWFEAAAKVLRAKGHEVVNPTEIDEEYGVVDVWRLDDGSIVEVELSDSYNYDSVISRDLDAVSECDGIVLGDHWVLSEGARLERATAIAHGLAVFYGVESVPDVSTMHDPSNWRATVEATPHGDYEVIHDEDTHRTYTRYLGPSPEPANWWAVTHNEPQAPEIDYPILGAVDMLRHQQVIAAIDRSEGVSQEEWDTTVNGEVRIVDPETGGAKGSKLARFDLLPADALWAVAEQYGRGSIKYDDRNWEKSYAWSLSFAAMMRHAWQFWGGEDLDEDGTSPHMAAVAWHALALLTFYLREIGTDDRGTTA